MKGCCLPAPARGFGLTRALPPTALGVRPVKAALSMVTAMLVPMDAHSQGKGTPCEGDVWVWRGGGSSQMPQPGRTVCRISFSAFAFCTEVFLGPRGRRVRTHPSLRGPPGGGGLGGTHIWGANFGVQFFFRHFTPVSGKKIQPANPDSRSSRESARISADQICSPAPQFWSFFGAKSAKKEMH